MIIFYFHNRRIITPIMDTNITALELERERLLEELRLNMDFVVGSISTKGLKCEAYNLTRKVDGVTRSRHIPKDKLASTRVLVAKHKRVKELLREIGVINWELHLASE